MDFSILPSIFCVIAVIIVIGLDDFLGYSFDIFDTIFFGITRLYRCIADKFVVSKVPVDFEPSYEDRVQSPVSFPVFSENLVPRPKRFRGVL